MVRAPLRKIRVVAEGHNACSVGVAVNRKFLDGNLGLARLKYAAERHKDGRAADGGVEGLDEALLAGDIGILEVVFELLAEACARDFALERIDVLDRAYDGL